MFRIFNMHTSNKYFIAILAILTAPLSGFAIDVYVPSLPAVSTYFHIAPSMAQLTISLYLIGFATVQLFIGSISDALGRKIVATIGFISFILLSLIITQINNIYFLILCRFLQGVAMGCVLTGVRASIADLFIDEEFHKYNGYLMLAWAIGPIIAPAIGGYLQHFFSWHASFYFLMIYAVLIFIPYFLFVPDTIKIKKEFNLNYMLTSYKQILSNKKYWAGSITCGCVYSIFLLFNMIAPFIIQNIFHYSVIAFGQIALLMGLAWFLGNLINRIFIRIDYKFKIKIALYVMITTIVITSLLSAVYFNIFMLTIPTFILLICGGLIFPNYVSANIQLFPEMAASAGALNGSILLAISAFTGSGLGTVLQSSYSSLPLDFGFMAFILISLVAYKIYTTKPRKLECV